MEAHHPDDAAVVVGTVTSASATIITYSLTVDDCSGGSCGTGPFGTVTVSSISSTEVSVNLTLAPGEIFATGGAGDALLFDLSGNPSITVSSLTSGFTATQTASGGSIHANGTGTWEYSIDCTGCGSGTSPPTFRPPQLRCHRRRRHSPVKLYSKWQLIILCHRYRGRLPHVYRHRGRRRSYRDGRCDDARAHQLGAARGGAGDDVSASTTRLTTPVSSPDESPGKVAGVLFFLFSNPII